MSDYDDLPEVDLRPSVDERTHAQARGGRKGMRTLLAKYGPKKDRTPLWRRQLSAHRASKAAHSK